MRLDLHCHSTASDGSWTPQQLAAEAERRRLELWSLTDHDTIAGWQHIRNSPGLIIGCEFSTLFQDREIHIVGLGFDAEDEGLLTLMARQVAVRRERAQAILDNIFELRGVRIPIEDCQTDAAMIIRSHIADALVRAGVVSHRQQAFSDLISDANVARWYTPNYVDPAGLARLVHAAGGVCVLAHPGLYNDQPLIEAVMADLDGVEVNHPRLDPNLKAYLRQRARRAGWLLSAGSDFHNEPCRLGDWRLSRTEIQPLLDAVRYGPASAQAANS